MRKSKPRVDNESEEMEVFYDSDFDAGEFIEAMEHPGEGKKERQRPARQRVELRSEEKWLRQQLSDWDDLDRDDDEE
jgi:hypothetical protein